MTPLTSSVWWWLVIRGYTKRHKRINRTEPRACYILAQQINIGVWIDITTHNSSGTLRG